MHVFSGRPSFFRECFFGKIAVFSGGACSFFREVFSGFIFRCVRFFRGRTWADESFFRVEAGLFFRGRNLVDELVFRDEDARVGGMFFRGVYLVTLGPTWVSLASAATGWPGPNHANI